MKKNRKPSSLTKRDIYNLRMIGESLSVNDEETVSQACIRFGVGRMPDKDLLFPAQEALSAMCKDNPKLDANRFCSWYQAIIDNQVFFSLDRNMLEAVRIARVAYDMEMNQWVARGDVDSDYNTSFAFWGIIGLVIVTVSSEIREKYDALRNDAFYKDPVFGRYRIIALEDADDATLESFPNNRSYNRFDVEAILLYVMDRYDWIDRHGEISNVYEEVKRIVYEDPNRMLFDTKLELERRAKGSSEKKFQYAFLYASAVIEYGLENQ